MKRIFALLVSFFLASSPTSAALYPPYPLPIPASQGGIFSVSGPSIQSGDVIVGFGDSITAGTGASSCSTGTTAHTPTGTCYLDLLGINYSAQVANLGISGTCLETPCFTGDSNSGYSRYVSAFSPFLSNPLHTWFVILYGANDISSTLASNVATPERYYTQYNTIVSYLISQGQLPDHITVGSITPQSTSAMTSGWRYPIFYEISAAAARVAAINRVRFADGFSALISCWLNANLIVSGTTVCSADGIHPNDSGHSTLATAFEGANFQN